MNGNISATIRKTALLSSLLFATAAHALCGQANTTLEIETCLGKQQKKVEARLNGVYQRVLKGLDQPDTEFEKYSEMKRALVEAQRAWVKFREADCKAGLLRDASGSLRNANFIGCMQGHAERRIKDLDAYERGD